MCELADLQELIFKNKQLMPEGDYIKMMEHLKDIYKKSQCTNINEDLEYECPHCSSYISGDELELVY